MWWYLPHPKRIMWTYFSQGIYLLTWMSVSCGYMDVIMQWHAESSMYSHDWFHVSAWHVLSPCTQVTCVMYSHDMYNYSLGGTTISIAQCQPRRDQSCITALHDKNHLGLVHHLSLVTKFTFLSAWRDIKTYHVHNYWQSSCLFLFQICSQWPLHST